MMYNVRPKAVIPEGYQFQSGQDTVTVLDSTVDEYYFEAFGASAQKPIRLASILVYLDRFTHSEEPCLQKTKMPPE
jgi:hypothetical protein